MSDKTVSSKFSRIDGRRIHYLTCGRGKPLILLHAYLSSVRTFSGLIKYLAEHYQVYAPDFPGFGLSDKLPGKPTLEESSKIITDWIIQEDLKNFILAGVSMGGTVATCLAKEIDDRAKGYVLIEPFLGPEALLFPKKIIRSLKVITFFFNRILPTSLGEKLWSSKKTLLFVDKYLSPLKDEKEKDRPIEQKLDILSCATYRTFWHTIDLLMKLDLSNEKDVSNKSTLLVMSPADESLDYQKTLQGFKKIFPSLKAIPIDLIKHYPLEPVTARYIKTHYPTLLRDIMKNLKT